MDFKIYFIDEHDIPVKQINEKDFPIFNLEITHKEGAFARLKILTSPPAEEIFSYKKIKLTYKDQELFKGLLQVLPTDLNGELVTLCYVAQPENYQQEVTFIVDKIKENHEIDPLFISSENELLDTLESLPYLIEWSRLSGEATLCPLLGKEPTEITDVFYDSLKLSLARKPYKAVQLNIHAHWMQQYHRLHDISETIKQDLPHGLLSTLTGKSLQKSWFKKGQTTQGKNYEVVMSSLQEYEPPPHQEIYYPSISIKFQGDKYFKRYWFEPELVVSWYYQQPRHEVLSFSVHQGHTWVPSDRIKTIHLTLNDIIGGKKDWEKNYLYEKGEKVFFNGIVFIAKEEHRSTSVFEPDKWNICPYYHTNKQAHLGGFFTTWRGQKAAAHALKIAQTHLLASARALEVQFSCPLDSAFHIDTTSTLLLRDKRLPEGACFGKVKGYRFTVNGETGEALAWISLGVSVGSQNSSDPVKLKNFMDQRTNIGIYDPTVLKSHDIVETVQFQNLCDSQQQIILDNGDSDPLDILNQHKTKLFLKLKDLNPVYPYKHTIMAHTEGFFQPQKQIGEV